jgi:hypothetical protein
MRGFIMTIWDFLSDKKNQQTLRWIGSAITATVAFGLMLWQHLNAPSLAPVAKPEKSTLPVVVDTVPPSSVKHPPTPAATPQPAVQRATSGNGGISVNASESSSVHINQHNNR